MRTLLLANLLLGAGGLLWLHWSPFAPAENTVTLTLDGNNSLGVDSTVEFSPDGSRLLFGAPGKMRLWDFKADPVPLPTAPLSYVWGARFSGDGASVYAFSHEKIVRIGLRGNDTEQVADFTVVPKDAGEYQSVRVLAVSSDGQYALTETSTCVNTSSGGAGRLSNRPLLDRVVRCSDHSVTANFQGNDFGCPGLSCDGKRAFWFPVVAGYTSLTVLDVATGQTREMRALSPFVFQGEMTVTADNRMAAYVETEEVVCFVDLDCMEVLERVRIPDAGSAFLSRDGTHLATVHDLKTVRIWKSRRTPGAFGPIDFPELWLAIMLGVAFSISLVWDIVALRRKKQAGQDTARDQAPPAGPQTLSASSESVAPSRPPSE
jgi:WD40 repeat protein